MLLQKKVFIYLGVTLLALTVILSITSAWLILTNAGNLETRRIQDHGLRIQAYVDGEMKRLEFLCMDWGAWDETYKLGRTGDLGYIDRYINADAIANFGVNLLFFANFQGEVLWGTLFDLKEKSFLPLPPHYAGEILASPLAIHSADTRQPVSGRMMLDGQPVLIASGPILTSKYEGPAVGSLNFGRWIDESFLALMSERLRLHVASVSREDALPALGDMRKIDDLSRSGAPLYMFNDARITRALIAETGPTGETSFFLGFTLDREIYQQGLQQLWLLIASIALSATVFGVLIWWLLRRDVLNRISALNAQVNMIREQGDIKLRLTAGGPDEIGSLGQEVNYMLASLEAQRSLSETYLNLASVMIGALDVHGKVTMLNPRGCQILGFTRDEIIGLDWFANFLPGRLREEVEKLFQHIMSGEMELTRFYENPVVTRTGEERMFFFHNELMRDARGHITGIIFSGEDITDRRKREAEQIRIEKLESLGLLAGGIAHDFNNTLTAIMANLDLIRKPGQVNTREHEEIVADATDAAVRAKDLATQLLTFSKGGAPVREIIHLPDLVRNAVRFISRGTGMQPELLLDDHSWPVAVDITQISQVIHNLMINASQAIGAGGHIWVRVQNVELGTNPALPLAPGSYVTIEVIDDGPGIPPEEIARIFDPYFTTKKAGSGLGLSTAFSIVRRHGGHITVTSSTGKGAAFCVYLPAQPETIPPAPRAVASPGARKATCRVLAVDDDTTILRVIKRLLETEQCEVDTAANSSAAFALFKEALANGNPYDVVLMDMVMPGDLGGLKIFDVLRASQPAIKAIVISGYSHDPVLSEPAKYGFISALAKPFQADALLAAIREAADKIPSPA